MNWREPIQRELRNARRVITNADKFPPETIDTAWAIARSAAKRNIYLHTMPFVSASDAYSCSPSQQSRTARLHEVQT